MQKKFLFVINPISGGTDKAPIENSIDQWVKENTLNATKYFTQGENDRDKIENYLNAESFTHLIGVGGDGTIVLVAGLAKKHNLPMGMIPAGSANGFATQLKIPSNTKQALKIILEAEEKSIDTLLFNQERLGLHISDLGLNAQLVEHFEETESRGFLGYASGVVQQLKNKTSFKVKLEVNDQVIEREVLMVALANANQYGSGARLNKQGKIDDGKFELCLLHDLDLSNIALHFLDFIDEHADYLTVIQCKKAVISVEKPQAFQVDGEYLGKVEKVEVTLEADSLRILIPGSKPGFFEKLLS